jgi:hypothetical protein
VSSDLVRMFVCQIKHHTVSTYGTVDIWFTLLINSTSITIQWVVSSRSECGIKVNECEFLLPPLI